MAPSANVQMCKCVNVQMENLGMSYFECENTNN
jgi:hypothetical protein